jgi:hypothetical protein
MARNQLIRVATASFQVCEVLPALPAATSPDQPMDTGIVGAITRFQESRTAARLLVSYQPEMAAFGAARRGPFPSETAGAGGASPISRTWPDIGANAAIRCTESEYCSSTQVFHVALTATIIYYREI